MSQLEPDRTSIEEKTLTTQSEIATPKETVEKLIAFQQALIFSFVTFPAERDNPKPAVAVATAPLPLNFTKLQPLANDPHTGRRPSSSSI